MRPTLQQTALLLLPLLLLLRSGAGLLAWLPPGLLPLQASSGALLPPCYRLAGGDVDVADLQAHAQYSGGYSDSSPTIRLFWKVVAGLGAADRSAARPATAGWLGGPACSHLCAAWQAQRADWLCSEGWPALVAQAGPRPRSCAAASQGEQLGSPERAGCCGAGPRRSALLKFVTSSSRAPLGGFKYLQPPFTLHLVHCHASPLVLLGGWRCAACPDRAHLPASALSRPAAWEERGCLWRVP
jgi:hypothetical protein